MKGEINHLGYLSITRGTELKQQQCPMNTIRNCGDHCPKFGEPYETIIKNRQGNSITGFKLSLCTRDQLFFTELIDRRK